MCVCDAEEEVRIEKQNLAILAKDFEREEKRERETETGEKVLSVLVRLVESAFVYNTFELSKTFCLTRVCACDSVCVCV